MQFKETGLSTILLRLLAGEPADNAHLRRKWGSRSNLKTPILKYPDISEEQERDFRMEIQEGWVGLVDGAPYINPDRCPEWVQTGRIFLIKDQVGPAFEEDGHIAILDGDTLHIISVSWSGPPAYSLLRSTRLSSKETLQYLNEMVKRSSEPEGVNHAA